VSNPSKRRGTDWEIANSEWLQRIVPHSERRAQSGSKDRGDHSGFPGIVIESKAEKAIRLAQYLKEVRAEMENDGSEYGFVWIKAPRKSIEDSYILMPPEVFDRILRVLLRLLSD
jgi:hypothetical protein